MKLLAYLFSFFVIATAANAQTKPAQAKQAAPAAIAPAKKPIHKASIAGKSNGNISRNELLNSKGVETSEPSHRITEYKMTIVGKDGEDMEFFNDKGGELTENMRAELKGADIGSKIAFEGIMCADSTNKTHKMNALTFLLK
jgi:hypothetical protein